MSKLQGGDTLSPHRSRMETGQKELLRLSDLDFCCSSHNAQAPVQQHRHLGDGRLRLVSRRACGESVAISVDRRKRRMKTNSSPLQVIRTQANKPDSTLALVRLAMSRWRAATTVLAALLFGPVAQGIDDSAARG